MKLLRKFHALFRKDKLDAEMAEEMRAHLEMQTEDNIARGMSPTEARYAALREFGGVDQIQETARDQRGWVWLEQFRQDVSYALRMLRKNPGFATASVAVLALGIGANSAVFNLVNTLLFAPPAYADPAGMVRVFSQDRTEPKARRDFSYPAYGELRDNNRCFSGICAFNTTIVGLGKNSDAGRAIAALVSSSYFSVLGVAPAQGRAFLTEEETPGRETPVAIVSHKLWEKHRFDPAFVGSTLEINGRAFTVIGVMPEGFTGTPNLFATELWLPLGVYDQIMNESPQGRGPSALSDRNASRLLVFGRLNPGLTHAMAEERLRILAANLERKFPVEQKNQVFVVETPSRFASSSNDRAVAGVGLTLLGMAAVVLLIACLNLASLLLARGQARRKEIAIRLALGGGRARIVRQLLTEGFVLALAGGAGGLLLAVWSSDLLITSLGRRVAADLAWSGSLRPSLLVATFFFTLLGTLFFALGPALKLTSASGLADLKRHPGEDVVRRRRKYLPRNPLVVAQIALSLALLTAAALFTRGAIKAASVDTGLKTSGDFLVELDASFGGLDESRAREVYRRLSERFAALPGVESASIAIDVPLGGLDLEKRVRRIGANVSTDGDRPANVAAERAFSAKWNSVGADYFKTVGIPLLRGRAFTVAEATQPGGPAVAVINDVLAKKLWPDGDALGQCIQLVEDGTAGRAVNSGGDIAAGTAIEVVGVVSPTRHVLFERRPDPEIYLPFARGFQNRVFFHVKFPALPAGTEAATADLLRRTVRGVDPVLPEPVTKTFAQHLDTNIQIWMVRAAASLFSVFGGLALILAIAGAYGVMAYSVARRTREIGIRMALGAQPGVVLRMILGEGAMMLVTGVLLGFLLAAGVGQIVGHLLYQVGAMDLVAFTVAPLVLGGAALIACWLPARRATKVDPMLALRSE